MESMLPAPDLPLCYGGNSELKDTSSKNHTLLIFTLGKNEVCGIGGRLEIVLTLQITIILKIFPL